MNTYSSDERQRLHAVLYDILAEIQRVCSALDIPFFLIGGSAIGAHYWQGIIPWDDDIDVGMTRAHYERFLREAPAVLSPDFFLQTPETEPQSPFYFAKLRRNQSVFLEHYFRRQHIHHGIYIDIFPFDRVPDSPFLQRLHRGCCNFLNTCFMGKTVWQWRWMQRCDVDVPRRRAFLPTFATWLVCRSCSRRLLSRWLHRVLGAFNGLSSARYYNMVLMPRDHIAADSLAHPQQMAFGPLRVSVPSDLETYLRHHYPQLRKELPEEEQENHRPAQLEFPPDAR